MTDDANIATYAWVDSGHRSLEGLSITLVRPASPSTIERLHPIRSVPDPMTIEEAIRTLPEAFALDVLLVQEDELDGWSILIEPFGWAGSTSEVLARLSEGGRAVNVYWNVNALMHVGWAEDGLVVRSFDPLLDDRRDARVEEADLPFGQPAFTLAAVFVLAERLTGIRISRDWLVTRRRRTSVIPVP